MLFCKEQTCKSLAVVGGYCLSHQLERANELYAQLNQRNDSCSRMSREITERIANESQLKQRAEAAEARATTAERERDEARAEFERVKAERDEAQHFLSRIIEHCDDDGVMQDGKAINLTEARKAAGMIEP